MREFWFSLRENARISASFPEIPRHWLPVGRHTGLGSAQMVVGSANTSRVDSCRWQQLASYSVVRMVKVNRYINACHPSIKFDCHQSRSCINYLDTNVRLDRYGNLTTSLYAKPTDRNAYLHHDSYHPPSKLLTYLPYGQFLRSRKICSSEDEATTAMATIEAKFTNRGYPKAHTELQKLKANAVDRGPKRPARGQTEATQLADPIHDDLQ